MARILVTGGAGFIGSHLSDSLLAQGHDLVVLDNLSTGKLSNLPLATRGLTFVQGDVADVAMREVAHGCDVIYHLAAVASVQASVDDPVGTHVANFDGTLNMLEAARRHGVRRVVYASSAAVYGDVTRLPVAEDVPLNPLTPYAADKLAGEYYLGFYYRQFGIESIACRFFNIFGPRQDPSSPYSGVISIFADRLRRDLPLTIFGDGEQTRDYVFVRDLVRILAKAMHAPLGHEVVNVGAGRATSLLQLVQALGQVTGKSIEVGHAPARAGDIRHSLADNQRLQALLDERPDTPLVDGLRELLTGLN